MLIRFGLARGRVPISETLYKEECSKCDGAGGAGETSLGRMFGAPDFSGSGWQARHSSSGELVGVITRSEKNWPHLGKNRASPGVPIWLLMLRDSRDSRLD